MFTIGDRVRVKIAGDYYEGTVVGRVSYEMHAYGRRDLTRVKPRRYAIDFDDGESLIIDGGRVEDIPQRRRAVRVAKPYYPRPKKRFGRRPAPDVVEVKDSTVDTKVPVFDPRFVVVHSGEEA